LPGTQPAVLALDQMGQHLGIEPIGLAALAQAARVLAHCARVQHVHDHASGVGQPRQALVVAAGGLHGHARARRQRTKPAADGRIGVRQALDATAAVDGHIQVGACHVHAHIQRNGSDLRLNELRVHG
jgi:hypothetical protein